MEETGNFSKKLGALVCPIAFQNLLTSLVSASDALMLGLLSQDSLSAISLAAQVQFVLSLFHAALTIGTTVLAAQYWGRKDSEVVEKVLAIALKVSLGISFLFFLATFCCPKLLMCVFTKEEILIQRGIPYLRIVSWSYLFMGVSQIYLCIMKNSGRTGRSTLYGSVALGLNIVLNAILIFGGCGLPEMGIAGAAVATVIARLAELLLVLLENRKKDVVCIRFLFLRQGDRQLQKEFFRYTTPVLVNELVWGGGITMVSVIMGHLGNDAVAANSIASIVKNIVSCVCLGVGAGSSIIVGNELGSGRLERAKEYGGKLCRIAVITGMISGIILWFLSPIVQSYAGGLRENSQEYLRGMLYICSFYMIGKAINSTVIGGIFCAGGDTRFGMVCDAITMWVIIVPLGMIAAFVWELPVMWVYFLLNLDEFVKLPAVYKHYKKYKWVKNLTGGQ